jgi:hypothetical protein
MIPQSDIIHTSLSAVTAFTAAIAILVVSMLAGVLGII